MGPRATRLYSWAIHKANSPRAPLWIGLVFFLELFLFIPLDAVLMFFCLHNRRKTALYVVIAAIASAMSAFVGYLIGLFLWDLVGSYVVPHLISTSFFEQIEVDFQSHESLAIFCGALLPFPLKALSLSAGVFHLGFTSFALFMGLGRMLRFFIVGGAMLIWGARVKHFVDKHFHRIALILGAKVAMAFFFIWILAR